MRSLRTTTREQSPLTATRESPTLSNEDSGQPKIKKEERKKAETFQAVASNGIGWELNGNHVVSAALH